VPLPGDCRDYVCDSCQMIGLEIWAYQEWWKLRFPVPSVFGTEKRGGTVLEGMRAIRKRVLAEESDMAKAHSKILNETMHLFEQYKSDPQVLGRHFRAPTGKAVAAVKQAEETQYDDTDSGTSDGDYDDSSNDYSTDSASGSNWDGSSGINDNGEEEGVELCYCVESWHCGTFDYDKEVMMDEFAVIRDYAQLYYQFDRTWMYQACTEWGFMVSANYGRNMFEDTTNVNLMIDMCSDIYGPSFNRTNIDNGVRNTNYMYGGQDNYNGTNVVFVNGSEDPWILLSVTPDHPPLQPDSVKTIVMKGESHAKDMDVWRKGWKDTIKKAQKAIKHQLWRWIKGSR